MRFKKNITPNETCSVYHPNTYVSFNLPRKKLDLHSLTLYYTGNPAVAEHIIAFNANGDLNFSTTLGTAPNITNAVDTTTNTITIPAHGLPTSTTITHVIYKTNGGNAIAPLVDGNRYILQRVDGNTVRVLNPLVASNYSSVPISLTSTGSGNQTFTKLTREYKSIQRHFPRLSSCIISELMIKIDNQVKQHIKHYNTINAILHDIHNDHDEIDSTNSNTTQAVGLIPNSYILKLNKLLPQTRSLGAFVSKYSDINKNTYFINKFLGFLGEGNRYFDATDKDVQIVIKLESPNILYKGLPSDDLISVTQNYSGSDPRLYKFDTDYEISDIKASIDVVDDMPMVQDFTFKDYYFQEGAYLPYNKKCLTSFSIDKPVEWILGTFKQLDFRDKDTELQLMNCNTNTVKFGSSIKSYYVNEDTPYSGTFTYQIAKSQGSPYTLNNSYWFSHQGDSISYCKYKWNGWDLTPQYDIVSCYNETKKCFNSDFKRVTSILGFESDFFCNAVRVDDDTNSYKEIQWEVEYNPTRFNVKGGYPMLFCCYINKV